jgi:hypothetical protein
MTEPKDQINNFVSHPAVSRYLGRGVKIVAAFAIVGCILLYVAITCLSNIITGALPH